VREYDRIFDAKFEQAISRIEVKDLWAKYSGVATPRGEIWLNGVVKNPKHPDKHQIKITTINGLFE
jgi:hypothetical protein